MPLIYLEPYNPIFGKELNSRWLCPFICFSLEGLSENECFELKYLLEIKRKAFQTIVFEVRRRSIKKAIKAHYNQKKKRRKRRKQEYWEKITLLGDTCVCQDIAKYIVGPYIK